MAILVYIGYKLTNMKTLNILRKVLLNLKWKIFTSIRAQKLIRIVLGFGSKDFSRFYRMIVYYSVTRVKLLNFC